MEQRSNTEQQSNWPLNGVFCYLWINPLIGGKLWYDLSIGGIYKLKVITKNMKTIIGVGIMASILTYIFISTLFIAGTKPVVYATEEVEQERKVVLIRVETSDERITRKINAAFPDEPRMAKVAWCESRLKEDAIGPDGRDHGLFQIRDIHDTGELNMFDEDDNIAYAKTLYNKNGLGDWKASFHCWSK